LRSSVAPALQSRGSERSNSQKLGLKRSGDDRKDDRLVKHIDTASDLFPLSLPTDEKASNPPFQLEKQLAVVEWIDLGKVSFSQQGHAAGS